MPLAERNRRTKGVDEMGIWLLAYSTENAVSIESERLKKKFSFPDFPPFEAQVVRLDERAALLVGGYRKPFPDLHLKRFDNGDAMLLHGALIEPVAYSKKRGHHTPDLDAIRNLQREQPRSFVAELDGSFSLASYEKNTHVLTLFTDRFASRPVWMLEADGVHYFSNVPSAFFIASGKAPEINPGGLLSFAFQTSLTGSMGVYRGMENLLAGARVSLSEKAVLRGVWFRRRFQPATDRTKKEASKQIAAALVRSAEKIAKTTDNLTLMLSGGLDSRIALAVLKRANVSFDCITLGSRKNAETTIAGLAAKAVGANQRLVIRQKDWYVKQFPFAALVASGNFTIGHSHFVQPAKRATSDGKASAMLFGDRLEGFSKHYLKPQNAAVSLLSEKPEAFRSLFGYGHLKPERVLRWMGRETYETGRARLMEESASLEAMAAEMSADEGDRFDALFRYVSANSCPTFLMFESIHPLCEERNLMYSNALDDLLMAIPSHWKADHRLHILTLQALSMKLSILPDANVMLPPVAPYRAKKWAKAVRPEVGRLLRKLKGVKKGGAAAGYKSPRGSWPSFQALLKEKEYRELIEEVLMDEAALPEPYFQKAGVEEVMKEFFKGQDDRMMDVLILLSFGLLHRQLLN